MCGGKFSRLLVFFLVITLFLQHVSSTPDLPETCAPSSCGVIPNISHPFRLKGDPKHCGDPRYELVCEHNVAVLSLFSGKYYVQSINYHNYTVRIVDPGLKEDNCSSFPRYFLSQSNFSDTYNDSELYDLIASQEPYRATYVNITSIGISPSSTLFEHIVYLNCSSPVRDDPVYVDTASCVNWPSKGHIYAIPGDLLVWELEAECHVKFAATMRWNWSLVRDNKTLSYSDIHRVLLQGFEVSWLHRACRDRCPQTGYICYWNTTSEDIECIRWYEDDYHSCNSPLGIPYKSSNCGNLPKLRIIAEDYILGIYNGLRKLVQLSTVQPWDGNPSYKLVLGRGEVTGRYVLPSIVARFLLGIIFLFVLVIYKWRRRHISAFGNIEDFLQSNDLMPIRYSFKEIKNMTRGFKEKLGEGGYGTVFKGKLRSGPFVAIKMLGKSKANGEEFINEVATIGRIHHRNVVRLIGFCVEGSKRALVYEFMPNGSLDKYIFNKEGSMPLNYVEIYKISLGVAQGIMYLHQGCDIQILHFDIKPHNILLDENLVPKVSDFGLAKLYPINNNIITLTAARGTIGYMAPELFYKNIGRVSYKADVYSFGMLLMEMASKRKNLNPHVEHSSQLYFPLWIYDQFNEEKDIEMEDVTEREKNIAKKMIIVALWCIQLKPYDRPSMGKVVEMLEGELESLEMPPKPSLYPCETISKDHGTGSEHIESNDSINSTSSEIVTNPLLKNST